MNKPDPALWELTCRRMTAAPEQIVFADDAPHLVDSARAFGMNAVLVKEEVQAVADIDALLRQ